MQGLLAVGIGGFLGALARYGITLWAVRAFGQLPAVGTFAANALGCLAIGVLLALGEARVLEARNAGLFLRTGLIGGLTTFSTFGLETFELARAGALGAALLNVGANLVVGLAAVAAGFALTRAALG
jgi:CrcB protein